VLSPSTAHAQIGGLIKRAIGEKVAEKAADKVDEKTRDDSAAGRGGRAGRLKTAGTPMASIQLTPDTLEHALRGLDVLARAFARRDSMQRVANDVGRRVGELNTANTDLSRTYHEKASVIHTCRDDGFLAIATKRGEELQRKIALDPALQQRYGVAYARYSAGARDAAQRGDSATLRKLQEEYYRAVFGPGFSFRQDTVTVTRQCGAELPKPPTIALEDSLRSESDRLTNARRELEIAARTDAIAQSGLPAERFDAARERIELWYRGKKKGMTPLPPEEEQALAAQAQRIERIMRALGVQG
jgi:hypothetical protein